MFPSSFPTNSMPSPAPSSRASKAFLRSVIIVAVLGGLIWGGRVAWKQISPGLFGTKRVDKIPLAKVKAASISEEITAVGRLRAVFSTELRSEINGRIVKISGVDGQRVDRDQEI